MTVKIWKTLYSACTHNYYVEIMLLVIVAFATIAIFYQYEVMESYGKKEATTLNYRDLWVRNLKHPYINNHEWQNVKETRQKLHIYSAYYDNRENKNLIHIVGVSEPTFNDVILCQLYFPSTEMDNVFVTAKVEPLSEDTDAELVAVLVTCVLPEQLATPRAVSVAVSPRLEISNLLLVQSAQAEINNHETKLGSMAICVEPLENYSQIVRLMEFIELHRLLGVDHFIFYLQSVSQDFQCLLTDYVKQGQVTIMNWNFPSTDSSRLKSKEQNEGNIAAANDCVYQTMSKYEYTMFLSIDEFMIPKGANSLKDLLRTKGEENHKNIGALVFKVANFYLEWPDDKWLGRNNFGLFFMTIFKSYQTTTESNRFTNTKPICKPKYVLKIRGMNNLELVKGYQTTDVGELQGLCHRYRSAPIGSSPPPLTVALIDRSARRFALRLIQAIMKQYLMSMPLCTLPHHEQAKIQLFGPNRLPVLLR